MDCIVLLGFMPTTKLQGVLEGVRHIHASGDTVEYKLKLLETILLLIYVHTYSRLVCCVR